MCIWDLSQLKLVALFVVWKANPQHVMSLSMTVLLKNLFTVHFQFDLLKLETNNTRDDELKHAWIIARWTVGWGDFFLTTVATSWVEPHSVWPPSMQFERAPHNHIYHPPAPPLPFHIRGAPVPSQWMVGNLANTRMSIWIYRFQTQIVSLRVWDLIELRWMLCKKVEEGQRGVPYLKKLEPILHAGFGAR